jgi:hypothetical protein
MSIADFMAVETPRDGRPTKIRALRPDDKAEMLAAIGRTSTQSLRRRFKLGDDRRVVCGISFGC